MTDPALLLMRLGYAALLLGFHGGPRFMRASHFLLTGEPWAFVDLVAQLGLPFAPAFAVASALSESVGAALVAAGLWTRVAASAIAVNMAVAVFHEAAKGDPTELPALYLLGAVVVALSGGGRFSIDAWRGSARDVDQRAPR